MQTCWYRRWSIVPIVTLILSLGATARPAQACYGGDAVVAGRVERNGTPLADTYVEGYTSHDSRSTTTNADGWYSMTFHIPWCWEYEEVYVAADGDWNHSSQATITVDQETHVWIFLY